ncbi:Short-chain dehydrogenase/reductase SDR OS=Tsukamurella paurometabola (strain ATCC 8368 / DSM/ CCUG 35730 / CIP 100753 / JCM 10117 / KCTC 9821 / NBRC 16120/ NCIMB 702349 / NCTC 13040) OX=521096 GN=Tpau_0761 PE=3 SV=1 [Tsukamurella paurometabola]|uniref:Short-chain dehydrogenase/reductase SDR n=1 Tax=Tsukamurella paurometabola (strain ATCC 8368 / DSM 20162 / CCUG 35730 / CIP 100753 / JCM 10117 / KCTC 9821 / NBRC 16120 / NCIMB 702349 / NCTC 13040) TaxID=521096 RepID=D5UTP4_TSUPD|nr:SDR family oxidoreductase [Tsukamurella paurometabola]ADG77398.1 short-chain dehydrogenase/reductase SDR [Tsukamurella paurometabola DSM 20162]SUP26881.1 2-(S)-hydroxypropyl-CoM dehydrogenase [Tsukamurella paurometabola]
MSGGDEFTGFRAIVTGGASGIGRRTAEELMARGATVAVIDVQPGEAPAGSVGISCDVGDDESVAVAVATAAETLGGVDGLVNNAGIGAQGTVEAGTLDEWRRVLEVNVLGTVRMTRAALEHLRRSATPAVVNTCSIAATAGLPGRVLYSASKGAIEAMTRAMAADHVREGIRFNCVNPGTVDTPWVRRLLESAADPEAEAEQLRQRQPTGRLVTDAEVAGAICYLLGPAASATTGTSLAVDGGMSGLRLPAKR